MPDRVVQCRLSGLAGVLPLMVWREAGPGTGG